MTSHPCHGIVWILLGSKVLIITKKKKVQFCSNIVTTIQPYKKDLI